METIRENIVSSDGIQLHMVPSKKFKTFNIVIKFKSPLKRETITQRALLPYIFQQGTKSYPDRSSFQSQLDNLYGAVFSSDGAKKGNNHIISLRLEVANEKFIEKESSLIDQALSLLNEIIFHPNTDESSFKAEIVNREKETLKNKIEAMLDDKMMFANTRLIDEMCKGEAYSTHVHGYLEDFPSITPESLYDYYQTLLTEDQIDIYVLGDFKEEEIKEKVLTSFNFPNNKWVEKEISADDPYQVKDEQQVVIEEQNIQQAKLHIGYRTNCTYDDESYYALQVFNAIYGGFPNSKLFLNVREKNSLAYYAASRIESHKGLLIVFSGIAPDDYEQAREIMELQLEEMRKGNFTQKDLDETKELIINQLLDTMDRPQGIIELLYQQVVGNKQRSPEQLIESIKKVTKEEVVDIANQIVEDTVYLLTNKGGESHA